MILHQQLPQPKDAPLEPWFAVHCESLTLFRCKPHGDAVAIFQLVPETSETAITSCTAMGQFRAAEAVANDLRRHSEQVVIDTPLPLNSQLSTLNTPYLLLNSLDGTTPAIMHTVDPVFICMADRKTAILHPTEHFRSSVDLSVEGWTYWHEDAQAHFEKLTVEFCQATGIPIPARIATAVRHV